MNSPMNYANRIGYSDVEPFEIIRRISDKTIEVRAMDAVRDASVVLEFIPGGFCGHTVDQHKQRWIITSNADNEVIRLRLHRDGSWRSAGGNRHRLSETPRKFYDYNF